MSATSTQAATASSPQDGNSTGKKTQSAFDFKSRAKEEQHVNEQQNELVQLRKMQKERFVQHKADPNAAQSAAYQKPASVANGAGTADPEWWDPFGWFTGSGDAPKPTGKPGGGGGGGGANRGANVRGFSDLPKPPPRMGG